MSQSPTRSYRNRLVHETSPYLLQHAHQPVDWYPWGEEAFERARRENKPILISIGYSACHWCHVMAHECFENARIAELINEHFVAIKVDREERPDVDAIYMNVCVALNGSGGWPLNVFTTPHLDPIFAGTYFPPEDRHGRPGFATLLRRIAELWRANSDELASQARTMSRELARLLREEPLPPAHDEPSLALRLLQEAHERFDRAHGGFGHAPKFPPDSLLATLLAIARREGNSLATEMVARTLDAMASGGLYDQLGGGFARYCVDESWTIPHFEKMLYNQAHLIPIYADAWAFLRNPLYRRVVRDSVAWLLADMRAPSGMFYAALDADSDGEEGKYYVWTYDEFLEILGPEEGRLAAAAYGVSPQGNFEHGRNVLQRQLEPEKLAQQFQIEPTELTSRMERIRERLLDARRRRVPPNTDDKIILGWNAATVSALVRAAQVFGEPAWAEAAVAAAEALWKTFRPEPSTLFRVFCKGRLSAPAVLEDYAFLLQALLDLYEHTFDRSYLRRALELADEAIVKFVDAEAVRVFTTTADTPALIHRLEDYHDGATPCPTVVLLRTLLRLDPCAPEKNYRPLVEAIFKQRFLPKLIHTPLACASAYLVHLLLESGPTLIVVTNEPPSATSRDLHAVALAASDPTRVVVAAEDCGHVVPALSLGGPMPSLHICKNRVCSAPARSLEEALALLHQLNIPVISPE